MLALRKMRRARASRERRTGRVAALGWRRFAVAALALCALTGAAEPEPAQADERPSSDFTTIVAPGGEPIFQTGLGVEPGDRFLDADDRMYEVTAVRGETAEARFVERVDIEAALAEALGEYPVEGGLLSELRRLAGEALGAEADTGIVGSGGQANRFIGIYHTHSDESYKPTSGETNEPWEGDIFQVGRTKSVRLRDFGLDVHHSYNRHDPHDGAAYSRSRRTAADILKEGPDALFDVHRDTPPRSVYTTTVDGKTIAQVLIVVGRQNPTMSLNEKFALALKDYASRHAPEVVRGIFYAHGDYNQDMFPRSLLLEVGTMTNTLAEAQRGVQRFANLVPAVMYGITEPLPEEEAAQRGEERGADAATTADERQGQEGGAGWRTAVLLAIGSILLGLAFLLLNESHYAAFTARFDEVTGRVRRFLTRHIRRRVK